MKPEHPFARGEIVQALSSVEEEVERFFTSLSDEEFILRVEDAWTPAEHLAHLNTSVSAVGRGVATSPWLLLMRFGPVRKASRPFNEIRQTYVDRLAQGAGATGPYVPTREELAPEAIEKRRTELLARWHRVNLRLRTAVERRSEWQLDRVRVPHPLLGKLTVREVLMFTLYHNQHHIAAAKRRLPRFAGGAATA